MTIEDLQRSEAGPAAEPTLLHLLARRARERADAPAYTFLDRGREVGELTWGDLHRRAAAVAGRLAERGLAGERVVLLCPPGLDFVAAFFACLRAGAVAVPVVPPSRRRGWNRLTSVVADARPAAILATPSLAELVGSADEAAEIIPATPILVLERNPEEAGAWGDPATEPAVSGDDLAFLQYTSGSTAEPKGVRVTHANLVHNQTLIRSAFGQSEESVIVGWLPLYHDMGLIGNVLQPLYCGGRCVLMSPMSFLRRPVEWLRAIHRYRATTSGGPNFAYELCLRKIDPESCGDLDLSSWRVAFNGAEPVRAETLERFSRTFAPQGFRRSAFYPCYGLAEATLFVTGGETSAEPTVRRFAAGALERGRAEPAADGDEERAVVGCGSCPPEQRLRVVDPDSLTPLPPGREGEIWLQGASVADGYWRRTSDGGGFGARLPGEPGEWLRTGDLGALVDGELFILGRRKDLIILRGRNHHPQDVEWTVARSHPALAGGLGAAFSVRRDGGEELVVVHELERGRDDEAGEISRRVRDAVAAEHEIRVHDLVLVRSGGVPRTTSGKVRRRACRDRYLGGDLMVIARSTVSEDGMDADMEPTVADGDPLTADDLHRMSDDERRQAILDRLLPMVARRLRVDPAALDPAASLTAEGLDSLRAIEIQHDVELAFRCEVPAAALLDGASCEDLAERVEAGMGRRDATPAPEGDPEMAAELAGAPFPLSRGQRSLWVLERVTGGLPVNTLYGALRLGQMPDAAALEAAFTHLARRHPALRTVFAEEAGEPVQRVTPEARLDLAVEPPADPPPTGAALRRRLLEIAEEPFEVLGGPLVRLRLLPAAQGGGHLVMAVHHLVADLWSLALLLGELEELAGGGEPSLPAPAGTYAGYVAWQEASLAGPRGEELRAYWHRRMADPAPPLDLPADRPRPDRRSFRGGLLSRRLKPGLTADLGALARRRDTTLYAVLLTAFKVLLHRYGGGEDLVVGSPSAGRGPARWSRTVGYFVNPLPLRTRLAGHRPFHRVLSDVRATTLGALEHQDMPYQVLAEELAEGHDPSRSPLFQTFFVFEDSPLPGSSALAALAMGEGGAALSFAGAEAETVALPRRVAQFDLMLLAGVLDGDLTLAFEFARDLFDDTTAERMMDHLERLLSAAAADPDRPVGDLALLSDAETREVLSDFQRPPASPGEDPRDGDATLAALCARQVAAVPDEIAVVEGVRELTYRQLDRRAGRLAMELRRRGAGPETLVGLLTERSLETVVAIFAILKTGAAYLPLDPRHPASRLRFVIEDAGGVHPLPVILVGEGLEGGDLAPLLEEEEGRILRMGREGDGDGGGEEGADAALAAGHPDQLAYVIYTSGSTGRPKGVGVSQRNVVRLLTTSRELFGFGREDVWTFFHSHGFDFSVWEVFGALLHGGRLVVVPHLTSRDPEAFHDLLRTEGVTVLNQTPSAFRSLAAADDAWHGGRGLALRTVVFGGEALDFRGLEGWIRRHGLEAPELVNMYGITETTVHVTHRAVGEADRGSGESRIGAPLPDLRVALLDDRLRPVPPGVPGEIHVGGAGLARGYLGRPALTAERFVPDPFAPRPGERLYRSGDLARRRPTTGAADESKESGEAGDNARPAYDMEYLGRRDRQVKVRGFRIELGEVEAVLRDQPGVGDAVVLLRRHRDTARLVAYLVAGDGGPAPAAEALRSAAADHLPDYAVPAAWVFLDELPVTVNGKLDRDALPAPEGELAPARRSAPLGEVETFLAGTWEELLAVGGVGREDDFFALGGHSLLATRLVSRLRDRYGVELSLRRIFERPTLAAMAADVEELRGTSGAEVEEAADASADAAGPAPLSFAQERLWFTHQVQPESPSYNMPAALDLEGELSAPALEAALAAVVARHRALRTRFPARDARPVQVSDPPGDWRLPRLDLSRLPRAAADPEAARLTRREALRPFDLAAGPLLRATLVSRGPRRHLLILTLHHIVADGWSIGVLVEEVAALYPAALAGLPSPLAPLTMQYEDYARSQRRELQGERLERLLAFWRGNLAGDLPVLELPADHPRPATRADRGSRVEEPLGPEVSRSLQAFAASRQVTPFIVLVALFQALLARYCDEKDVLVGTDHANRLSAGTEALIGFFINLLVLRTDLGGRPGLDQLVRRVTDVVLDAFAHQELPFGRLVSALRPPRKLDHTPLFQVLFVFQNAPMPDLELPGLRLTARPVDTGRVKFDLVVFVEERDGELVTSWHYRTDLFEPSTIGRMAADYRQLTAAALAAPDRPLADFELNLDREERDRQMETKKRRKESISKLRGRRRRGVDLARFDPVTKSTFADDEPTPLILEPRGETDLEEWIAGHRDEVEADLDRHGALLLRGFGVDDAESFEAVAGAVAGELFGDYGDLPHEPGDGKVYRSTPYPADRAILFHNESAHLPQWPLRQFFHCVEAADEGGETPIVDCRRVHAALDPELLHRFTEQGLLYVRNFVEPFDVPWKTFFQTEEHSVVEEYCRSRGMEWSWNGDVLQTRTRAPAVARHPRTGEDLFFNQIQVHHVACLEPGLRATMEDLFAPEEMPRNVYFGDGEPIPDEVVTGLVDLYYDLSVEFPWQPGDVLVVDNMLIAHARNPFSGSRKICVCMGHMVSAA